MISHHIGQLIQQQQMDAVIFKQLLRALPNGFTSGHIGGAVLRLPGKTCCHHRELDAMLLQQTVLNKVDKLKT